MGIRTWVAGKVKSVASSMTPKIQPKIRLKPAGQCQTAAVQNSLAKDEMKSWSDVVTRIESLPVFLLGKHVYRALVSSSVVTIESTIKTPETEALRANLELMWSKYVSKAFECFAYGRVAFEKKQYRDSKGKLLLDGFEVLDFKSTEMELDDNGIFIGVILKVEGHQPINIPANEVWWCALDASAREPHGRSRYFGAPLQVYHKLIQLGNDRATFDRKFSLGNRVIYAPSEYPTNPITGKGDIGEKDTAGELSDPIMDTTLKVAMLEQGGVIGLPSERDERGNRLFEVTSDTSSQAAATPLENRQRELDRDALHSLGIPEKAVIQGDGIGSQALGEVHMEVLAKNAEEILSQMVASFQTQVVDEQVRLNFAPGSRPKFTVLWTPVRDKTKESKKALAQAILNSPTLSPLVTSGFIDLRKLFDQADIPLGANLEQSLRAAAQIAVTAQQPAYPGRFSLNTPPKVTNQRTLEDIASAQAKDIVQSLSDSLKGDGKIPTEDDARRHL